MWAAGFAFAATLAIVMDKALSCGEKWKFHLRTLTTLEAIRLEFTTGRIETKDTVSRVNQILEEYAAELPIERVV